MTSSNAAPPGVPGRESVLALLHEHTETPGLRKHALAVEAAMRAYARKLQGNEELWGVTGLIHDFDYEKHPTPAEHPFVGCRRGALLPTQHYGATTPYQLAPQVVPPRRIGDAEQVAAQVAVGLESWRGRDEARCHLLHQLRHEVGVSAARAQVAAQRRAMLGEQNVSRDRGHVPKSTRHPGYYFPPSLGCGETTDSVVICSVLRPR